MRYDYPGNVRELRNLIERLYVLVPGETIELADLPHRFREGLVSIPSAGDLRTLLREYERRLIEAALREHGTTYAAAAALGVNQSTIVRKLQAYRRGESRRR
jgi:DNA-binding NtrC family response regulator